MSQLNGKNFAQKKTIPKKGKGPACSPYIFRPGTKRPRKDFLGEKKRILFVGASLFGIGGWLEAGKLTENWLKTHDVLFTQRKNQRARASEIASEIDSEIQSKIPLKRIARASNCDLLRHVPLRRFFPRVSDQCPVRGIPLHS